MHLTINKGVRRGDERQEGGFGGVWDAAIDNSSVAAWDDDNGYVGRGTAGRSSNSGSRCLSWCSARAWI